MYVTATQPTVAVVQHETAALRHPQTTVSKPTATSLKATFMEQQGVGRLEELAETLDFPLDFQI